jgi:hypothetical protein
MYLYSLQIKGDPKKVWAQQSPQKEKEERNLMSRPRSEDNATLLKASLAAVSVHSLSKDYMYLSTHRKRTDLATFSKLNSSWEISVAAEYRVSVEAALGPKGISVKETEEEILILHVKKSSVRGKFSDVKKKLNGLSSRANYTDRATASCRRSECQLLRIEGATWSAWQIPAAVFWVFWTGAATFLSSSSSVVLTGLIGPRSRSTTFFW